MTHFRTLVLGLLSALVLVGCGVRVEVMSSARTAATTPSTNPSGAGIRRVLATPRFVFLKGEPAQIQLFMLPTPPDILMVKGRTVQLAADFDATWFADAQGAGRISLTLFTRHSPDQAWVLTKTVKKTWFSRFLRRSLTRW